MERFPDIEVVVPEGLTQTPEHRGILKRSREFNRRWVAEAAKEQGISLEAAQARALSPSQEGLLMRLGEQAERSKQETGEIQPVDFSVWWSEADARSWMFNFWTSEMADFEKDKDWTITEYGVEVFNALKQQYEREKLGRLAAD